MYELIFISQVVSMLGKNKGIPSIFPLPSGNLPFFILSR